MTERTRAPASAARRVEVHIETISLYGVMGFGQTVYEQKEGNCETPSLWTENDSN